MASDVCLQHSTYLEKAVCESIWADESSDMTNHATLAAISRYAVGDIMREESAKRVPLPQRTQRLISTML